MTAPDSSVTVPLIAPRSPCANAIWDKKGRPKTRHRYPANRRSFLIIMLFSLCLCVTNFEESFLRNELLNQLLKSPLPKGSCEKIRESLQKLVALGLVPLGQGGLEGGGLC